MNCFGMASLGDNDGAACSSIGLAFARLQTSDYIQVTAFMTGSSAIPFTLR